MTVVPVVHVLLKVSLTHMKYVKIRTSIPCNLCAIRLVYVRIIKSAITNYIVYTTSDGIITLVIFDICFVQGLLAKMLNKQCKTLKCDCSF